MKLLPISIQASLLIFASTGAQGEDAPPKEKHPAISEISWVALAANPEKYTKHVIMVCGWLRVSEGRNGMVANLFLTKEAYDYSDTTLMVAVEPKSLMAQREIEKREWIALSGERVRIQGLFVSKAADAPFDNHRLSEIIFFAQTKPGAGIWPPK